MPKDSKHRNLGPVLIQTLDILELLLRTDAPLKMNEFSHTTGISQTTTYRMLQTLVHRGYLARDSERRFSRLGRVKLKMLS